MEREKEVVAGDDGDKRVGGAKPQEPLLGAKLRRRLSVTKRGGTCTPVCAWKLEEDAEEAAPSWANDSAGAAVDTNQDGPRTRHHHRHRVSLASPAAAPGRAGSTASVRELDANLWEIQDPPHYRMGRRSSRIRHYKDEKLSDVSDLSPLGHREQAVTPPSSLDLKGRLGYSCRTSTELLKVLNRIWSLEEQHTSTVSLVTKLKLELEKAQACIQELLQEKQSNHREIDSLTKQIVEDKLTRKSKEHERIKTKVKSLKSELEDERRLRMHSESLHRRLGKELYEIKSAFSKIMRDLERERKTNNLLEDLCDEFARGIREYEEELRELKGKSEKGPNIRCNSLILEFSEAWLDERLHIKLVESQGDLSERMRLMDKLECEVEAFLEARRSCSLNDDVVLQKDIVKGRCLRRHSLESIHLNGAGSAPQYAEDEDSVASDLHCFELNVGTSGTGRRDSLKHNGVLCVEKLEEARNSNVTKKTVGSSERLKYQGSSSSWMKLDGHTQPCSDVKAQFIDKVQGIYRHNISDRRRRDASLNVGGFSHQRTEEGEGQEAAQGIKIMPDGTHPVDDVIDNSVIESELGEFLHKQHHDSSDDDSCQQSRRPSSLAAVGRDDDTSSDDRHAPSSQVQKWSHRHVSPVLRMMPETSKPPPQGIQESTLKAKLLEARLEGQHARLKTPRDSSVGASGC